MLSTLSNIKGRAEDATATNLGLNIQRGVDNIWTGMSNTIQTLHRGANHFQYTILDTYGLLRTYLPPKDERSNSTLSVYLAKMTQKVLNTLFVKSKMIKLRVIERDARRATQADIKCPQAAQRKQAKRVISWVKG